MMHILTWCIVFFPAPGYVRYDILSCYTSEGRMSNPHHDILYNQEYGYKMFYPNRASSVSPATAQFKEGVPPPLCDYPRQANMMLLRSAVNTGQQYDSSPALQIAINAQ